MKNKVIICFPVNGGVRQFTDDLHKRIQDEYIYDILGGKKKNRLKILKYLLFKEIIFSNNNILIYIMLPFIFGKITLILHDHRIRKGAKLKEKLNLSLFNIFRFRFNTVIIHSQTDPDAVRLLKYKNVHYLAMPPHGMPLYFNKSNQPYDRPIKILCFGRIEKYKNFEYIADVLASNHDYKLTIAGSGSLTRKMKELVDNHQNIKIINKYILNDELVELMNDHHYLALPYSDLTQTGLIELAGFFQKPVILSNIPAFKEFEKSNFCYYISLNNIELAKKELNSLKFISEREYISLCSESAKSFTLKMNLWKDYLKKISHNKPKK